MRIGDLLEIGRSALLASQTGLAVTSSNIANAQNPNYSRREVILSLSVGSSQSGRIAGGVEVSDVKRVYDRYIGREIVLQEQATGRATAENSLISQIEQVFNSAAGSGLDEPLREFFSAWNDVAMNPEGYTERTNLLGKAKMLVSTARQMESSLNAVVTGINRNMVIVAEQINAISSQIAALNREITSAQAGSATEAAPGLRDERDGLMKRLAGLTEFSFFENSTTGAVTIMMGPKTLVSAVGARQVTAGTDEWGMTTLRIDGTDVTSQIRQGTIGGSVSARDAALDVLGGLRRLMAAVVNETNMVHSSGFGLDALGSLPVISDFSTGHFSPPANTGDISTVSINASDFGAGTFVPGEYRIVFTSATTFDVYKNSDPAPVIENAVYDPLTKTINVKGADVVFSSDPAEGEQFYINTTLKEGNFFNELNVYVKSFQNSGVSVNTTTDPPRVVSRSALAYEEYEIRFTGSSTFNVVNISRQPPEMVAGSTGITWSYADGAPIEFEGLRIVLNGTPQSGDRFFISPTRTSIGSTIDVAVSDVDAIAASGTLQGLPGDNANALALFNLRNIEGIFPDYEMMTMEQYYQSLVSSVALKADNASGTERFQKNLSNQLVDMRDAISGVSLEEEAVNLIMFQRSFEAAARIISVTDDLMSTIISLR